MQTFHAKTRHVFKSASKQRSNPGASAQPHARVCAATAGSVGGSHPLAPGNAANRRFESVARIPGEPSAPHPVLPIIHRALYIGVGVCERCKRSTHDGRPRLKPKAQPQQRQSSHKPGAEKGPALRRSERRAALNHNALAFELHKPCPGEVEGVVVHGPEHCHGAYARAPFAVVFEALAIRPVHRRRAACVAVDADDIADHAVSADHAERCGHLGCSNCLIGQAPDFHEAIVRGRRRCARFAGPLAVKEHVIWIFLAFADLGPCLALRAEVNAIGGLLSQELAVHAGQVAQFARMLVQEPVRMAARGVGLRAELVGPATVAVLDAARASGAGVVAAALAACRGRVPMPAGVSLATQIRALRRSHGLAMSPLLIDAVGKSLAVGGRDHKPL
mmetsp:Transcript_100290/g.288121  ORF Transcript_100290/g.288121 Transcript_100290/m.288121 type:complete len:390 (-) Transcript_100290:305-1474(-)